MRVEFDAVSVRFGERTVLHQLTRTLDESRIGLIGGNGSGKSTLARLINGLVSADSGRVRVDGLDVARNAARVRANVGFVFTNPDSQIVMPTVREDVAFSLRKSGLPAADQRERVSDMLERFGLTELADSPAHRLSGGQKQLLALAAILITEPQLVIADEPTTLLDARNAARIAAYFSALPQQLIVATHDLDSLTDFDRVLVLDGGRIVADDAPKPAIRYYRALVNA